MRSHKFVKIISIILCIVLGFSSINPCFYKVYGEEDIMPEDSSDPGDEYMPEKYESTDGFLNISANNAVSENDTSEGDIKDIKEQVSDQPEDTESSEEESGSPAISDDAAENTESTEEASASDNNVEPATSENTVISENNTVSEDIVVSDNDITPSENKPVSKPIKINTQISEVTNEESGKTYVIKQKIDITEFFADTENIARYKINQEDKKIATVSKKGIFKGKKAGTARVIAVDKDKNELKSVEFTIIAPKLKLDISHYLEPISANDGLTDNTVKPTGWSSSNKKIAEIDPETGLITPLKNGSCKIYAIYEYGLNKVKITSTYRVKSPVLSAKKVKIGINKKKRLKLKNATESVEWKSDDDSIASVDNEGVIYGKKSGMTNIHAFTHGLSYNCIVTVQKTDKQVCTIDLGNGQTKTIDGYFDKEQSAKIMSLVNNYRKSKGLNELKHDTALDETGKIRGAEVGYLYSHDRPNGYSCFSAFPAHNAAGENIAAGYSSAESVFEGWKNSPGHNANMLNSSFNHAAMYLFITDYDNETAGCMHYYWVQCFTD